jgi:hypothetical protein
MLIICKFLDYLNQIKLYHWNTMEYSRHKASDELYSNLQDTIDKFVECYIGRYGRKIVFQGSTQKISLDIQNDKSILKLLDDMCKFLEKDIPKYIKSSDTDLLNIRDEILGHVNQTKYLFTLN